VLAPYRVAGHAPRMVPGLSLMSAFFGTGRWAIGPELRTLVHLRVAQIVGCVF
jgi:alkylhydroperoxidase family enzyme